MLITGKERSGGSVDTGMEVALAWLVLLGFVVLLGLQRTSRSMSGWNGLGLDPLDFWFKEEQKKTKMLSIQLPVARACHK